MSSWGPLFILNCQALRCFFKSKKLCAVSVALVTSILDYFALRAIRTHDIFHVIMNMGTSKFDEYYLFAVQLAQFGASSQLMMLAAGMVQVAMQHPDDVIPFMDKIVKCFEAGKQMKFLNAYPFEDNFHKPLSEVRAELNAPEWVAQGL